MHDKICNESLREKSLWVNLRMKLYFKILEFLERDRLNQFCQNPLNFVVKNHYLCQIFENLMNINNLCRFCLFFILALFALTFDS